ncbi:DUF58 domain-containing protein [bacterium]|nr:DUF58 domain-containing protein [bacterium]
MSAIHHTSSGLASRMVVVAGVLFFIVWMLMLPSSPAQAAIAAFLLVATLWSWMLGRGQLKNVRVGRVHRPRVFEQDRLDVTLTFTRGTGLPIQLLEVEDRFMGSMEIMRRHLIPWLAGGWEVVLHYRAIADRHRGHYFIGPVRIHAADPLGIFMHDEELGCITPLIIYPRADPLPDYTVPGDLAQAGASMNFVQRVGVGEEVLGVREYFPGDPPGRIHWRTSARRGQLHVIELDRPIQSELAVMLDMSRRSRYGLGAEASTELSIRAATSVLTRAHETRHRFSLAYVQHEPVTIPAGAGMAHLHMLLDRLAILNPSGEGSMWRDLAPRALLLPAGSRAVFICALGNVPVVDAVVLLRRLGEAGVGVDCILVNEQDFIKIYHDQERDIRTQPHAYEICEELRLTGARLWLLDRERASLAGIHPEEDLIERTIERFQAR